MGHLPRRYFCLNRIHFITRDTHFVPESVYPFSFMLEYERKEMREMEKISEKKYSMGSNVLFMIKEAAGNVPSVLWLVVLQAVIAVGISLTELFVTPVLLSGIQSHDSLWKFLALVAVFVMGILFLRALAAYVEMNVHTGRIQVRLGLIIRLVTKSARCSYPLMEEARVQNKQAKAWESLESNGQAGEAVWETLCEILKSVMGFTIYLFLLKNVSPILILVTLLTTICGYLVTNYIGGWEYRHRQEKAEIIKKLYYAMYRGKDRLFAKDVRIFGMEAWIGSLIEKYQQLLWDFSGRGQKKYLLADVVDILLAFLRNAVAYGYLLSWTIRGELEVAQFLLLFTAVGGFTEWISKIFTQFTVLHRQSLELSSFREFLDQDEVFRMEEGIVPEMQEDMEYTIELKDVTFRYPGAETPVFEHLNLTILAGEKLAVVGLNGAGKTTLIKLACGFYDPDEGEVLLNGINVKEFNRREYYRLFAGVFQSFSILPGSILLNVAQTVQGADRERALACIEKAGLLQKIKSLPEGLDSRMDKTVFNDAIELSGGEMQRLMLARLLYRDSPVIVLDEPTAALDAIAESDIYTRYQELTRGHTSIYISHRLASTRFCDRIILIEDGKIIEEGTHQELMERGGRYAELFEIQSKYYREGGKEDEERKEAFG